MLFRRCVHELKFAGRNYRFRCFIEQGKNTRKEEWINQKLEIVIFIDLSASVEMTLKWNCELGHPAVRHPPYGTPYGACATYGSEIHRTIQRVRYSLVGPVMWNVGRMELPSTRDAKV